MNVLGRLSSCRTVVHTNVEGIGLQTRQEAFSYFGSQAGHIADAINRRSSRYGHFFYATVGN